MPMRKLANLKTAKKVTVKTYIKSVTFVTFFRKC